MATNKVTRKSTEKKGDLIKFYRDMLLYDASRKRQDNYMEWV